MGKRMTGLDTLGEVRRAQRILRRVEKWLTQGERDVKRKAKKDREAFEAKQAERVERGKKKAPSPEWDEAKRLRDANRDADVAAASDALPAMTALMAPFLGGKRRK